MGTLAALDADESAEGDGDGGAAHAGRGDHAPVLADGAPDFATALAAAGGDPDQLPSLQIGLAHLVEDVAIHAVKPPAVRGGTDPSGAALRFLDAVTLDEAAGEAGGDDAAEPDATDYCPRSRVGVNYASRRSGQAGAQEAASDGADDGVDPGSVWPLLFKWGLLSRHMDWKVTLSAFLISAAAITISVK